MDLMLFAARLAMNGFLVRLGPCRPGGRPIVARRGTTQVTWNPGEMVITEIVAPPESGMSTK